MNPQFVKFPKIARFSREIIVTEKIDGTNALVHITEAGEVFAGSRTRWIPPPPAADNHGFAAWVEAHRAELLSLGPGSHFGEWWGKGIHRGYGVPDNRFSLFNVTRWGEGGTDAANRPACCLVVPVLFRGRFDLLCADYEIERLRRNGSSAAPGFMQPEGIVIFHAASGVMFKKTLERDSEPKSTRRAP